MRRAPLAVSFLLLRLLALPPLPARAAQDRPEGKGRGGARHVRPPPPIRLPHTVRRPPAERRDAARRDGPRLHEIPPFADGRVPRRRSGRATEGEGTLEERRDGG